MVHCMLGTLSRLLGLMLMLGLNGCRVTMCFGLGLGIGQVNRLLGASQRVARGDEAYIRVLREVDGVPEAELKKFVDPLYMAQYYTDEGRLAVKGIGFSVDWRREFTTIMPTFQKFIEWQYKNLKEKGYVTRGTHPVVWCPKDQSPTGDHDRQIGEGVTPEEYTLIKYRLDENTVFASSNFPPRNYLTA